MKHVKDQIRPHGFTIAFFVTLLLFVVCLLFLPIRYETNDDFGNVRRLTAMSGFEPDSFSPVHGQFLGFALYALYQAAPDIPWYGLTVYTTLLLGMFLMVAILARHGSPSILVICLPGLALFFFHAIVLVNYTTAALFVEAAVFLSWTEWIMAGACPARRPGFYAGLLVVGLALGYMLRWKLTLLGLALAFPILFFIRKPMLRKAWPVVLAILAFIVADRAVYELGRPETAKQYMHFNELRRVFHDTATGEFYEDRTPAALKKAGWSRQDYVTFKNWILYDNTLFNADTLKIFLSENDPLQSASLLKMIPDRLMNSFFKSKYYSLVFLSALGALILIYLPGLFRMDRMDRAVCLTVVGISYAILVFFAYYRFEPRIYLPLFSYALVLTVLILKVKSPPMPSAPAGGGLKNIFYALAAFLAMIAYINCHTQARVLFRLLDASLHEKTYVVSCLKKLLDRTSAENPLLVVMDPTNSLATQSVHPLKEMTDYTPVRVMPGGTGVNSPRYTDILHSLGLETGYDFLKWTIDNDQVLFALLARGPKHQKGFVSLWESYYNRNIMPGGSVSFKPVMGFRNQAGAGLILFKMVAK